VAQVWPELGAHGKDGVTLRHVLLHTAGVPGLPTDTTVADLCDWDRMCAVIADAEPWWEAGQRFGYHAKTFGFLVGEIVPAGDRAADLGGAAGGDHRAA
jgi:CubicO group peptidase (beta-lactamase class C family)